MRKRWILSLVFASLNLSACTPEMLEQLRALNQSSKPETDSNSTKTPSASARPVSTSQDSEPASSSEQSGSLAFRTDTLQLSLNARRVLTSILTEVPANLSWSSSNRNVEVDSATGEIVAKSPGTALITVRDRQGHQASLTVRVENRGAASNVRILPDTAVLNLNHQLQLRAEVTTADGQINADVRWSSSDNRVAAINTSNGIVNALQVGAVTIVGTAADGTTGTMTLRVIGENEELPVSRPSEAPITFGPGGNQSTSPLNPLTPSTQPVGPVASAPPLAPQVQLTGRLVIAEASQLSTLDLNSQVRQVIVSDSSYLGAPPTEIQNLNFDGSQNLYFRGVTKVQSISYSEGKSSFYQLNLAQGQLQQLDFGTLEPNPQFPNYNISPINLAWFNQALHLIYVNGSKSIQMKTLDGALQKFEGDDRYSGRYISWSQQGQSLYQSDIGNKLYLGNQDGSISQPVVDPASLGIEFYDTVPAWNHAGDRATFLARAKLNDRDYSYFIYSLDLSGSLKKLTSFKSSARLAALPLVWSPDDRYIGWSDGSSFWVIPASGGSEPIKTSISFSGKGLLWIQ